MPIPLQVRLGAVVALGMLVGGCTQVQPGDAVRDPGFDATAPVLALLETGNYPTTPRAPLGNAGTPEKGAIYDAHRMFEHLVFPFDIDPSLTSSGGIGGTGIMKSPEAAGLYLENKGLVPAIAAHNFVTGIAHSASDGKDAGKRQFLRNAVLQFRSPEDATAAAAAIAEATASRYDEYSKKDTPLTPQPIPRHPDAVGRGYVSEGEGLTTSYILSAYTAHGPYLLSQTFISRTSMDAAAEVIANVLDKQIPEIDKFQPTPYDKLAELPIDPTGLLARMLEPSDKLLMYGGFGPRGLLLFEPHPIESQKMIAENGVDFLGYENGFLIRARDAEGSTKMLDGYIQQYLDDGWSEADGVPGLPAARCVEKPVTDKYSRAETWCGAPQDRYLLQQSGAQGVEVRQSLSAGYLMLAAK